MLRREEEVLGRRKMRRRKFATKEIRDEKNRRGRSGPKQPNHQSRAAAFHPNFRELESSGPPEGPWAKEPDGRLPSLGMKKCLPQMQ